MLLSQRIRFCALVYCEIDTVSLLFAKYITEHNCFPCYVYFQSLNMVKNGVTGNDRAPQGSLIPWRVIDISNRLETDDKSKGISNNAEALYMVSVIQYFLSKYYTPQDISIISS